MTCSASFEIDFEPTGRRGECLPGVSLLECARGLVGIASICGGRGTCHSCRIRVLQGSVSPPSPDELSCFSPEEIEEGWRLACEAHPLSPCRVLVPAESMTTVQRTQVEGVDTEVKSEPAVKAYHVKLRPPSLSNPVSDAERLSKAMKAQHHLSFGNIDITVLRELSPKLRSWGWRCQVVLSQDEVIAIAPETDRLLGLAIDMGTTKIAGYLVELATCKTLTADAVMNPQISFGEDVISRIACAASSKQESIRLQEAAISGVNGLVRDLCYKARVETTQVVDAVVVANTAEHHLLLNLPVAQLAQAPYVPVLCEALDIKARDIGLDIAPGAYLHILPNIAGFVGSDHTAALLATGAHKAKGVVLLLDIGTNTEISLIVNGKIDCVSCASGPVFEGGHVKHGMRAASGAIERLRLTDGIVQYQTVDGTPPLGICGSGILDALAQLYLAGIVDKTGRMAEKHPRVRCQGAREFLLVSEEERGGRPAIVITQRDIREVQLGKAAIRAGIQILLDSNDLTEEAIDQIIIAGAFGSYIDIESAIDIGMLPALPLGRFRQVGNAAGMGARVALLSISKRTEAREIASSVRYLELAQVTSFAETFARAICLGRYWLTHDRREEIR